MFDPIFSNLLTLALFITLRFDVDMCVFRIDDAVIFDEIRDTRLVFDWTNNVPIVILLTIAVSKLEFPEIRIFVVEKFIVLTLVDNKLVVVSDVFEINGANKLIVLILPVLIDPVSDILLTFRFEIVEVFTIVLLKNALVDE